MPRKLAYLVFLSLLSLPAAGQICSPPPVSIGLGGTPGSVMSADFDGDTHPDLAVSVENEDGTGRLDIHLGNGDGTFRTSSVETGIEGAGVLAPVAAQLGGGPGLDIVWGNRHCSPFALHVFLDNGDGTYADPISHEVSDPPGSVFITDLDGDTRNDLISGAEICHHYSVLRGRGGGDFDTEERYLGGDTTMSIFAADLDGEGGIDFVLANAWSQDLLVFMNGVLDASTAYFGGTDPRSVWLADLDGRNGPDMAVANSGSDDVSIFFNLGDGTFGRDVRYPVGEGPISIVAADLDGDSDLDLATTNEGSMDASLLLNRGDGSFAAEMRIAGGYRPVGMTAADFDGDGTGDLAVAGSGGLALFFHPADGRYSPYDTLPVVQEPDPEVAPGPGAIAVADLDGDGRPDLAVASWGSREVVIFSNGGDGTFPAPVRLPTTADVQPVGVVAADLDGADGDDLLVLLGPPGDFGRIWPLYNEGDGTFRTDMYYFLGRGSVEIVAADLDGTRGPDVAAANAGSEDVSVRLNDGDGTLGPLNTYPVGRAALGIAVADLDGTNGPDLVVASPEVGGRAITVLLNFGDGTFRPGIGYGEGRLSEAAAVDAADLDGDTRPDVVLAQSAGPVHVFLGDGQGSFARVDEYEAGPSPRDVLIHDLDGRDGPDILVAGHDQGVVSVLFNEGDGTFAEAVAYGAGNSPFSLAAADLDGIAGSEIVVANLLTHGLSVIGGCSGPDWLLRSDAIVSRDPLDPPLDEIFTGFGDFSLDLEGPDGRPGKGEGTGPAPPGSDDDDHAYLRGYDGAGWNDLDTAARSDPDRPLIFYEVTGEDPRLRVRRDRRGGIRVLY